MLLPLFQLADDSITQIARWIDHGLILTASAGDVMLGHVQIIEREPVGEFEIRSLSVAEGYERRGIGRSLVDAAAESCRDRGGKCLFVCTATAATDALRFYQRCDFRFLEIIRDAFPPSAGYPGGTLVNGIPLRDAILLELIL